MEEHRQEMHPRVRKWSEIQFAAPPRHTRLTVESTQPPGGAHQVGELKLSKLAITADVLAQLFCVMYAGFSVFQK